MEELSQREILESFAKTVGKLGAGALAGTWKAAKFLAPGITEPIEDVGEKLFKDPWKKAKEAYEKVLPVEKQFAKILLKNNYKMVPDTLEKGKKFYFAKAKLIKEVKFDPATGKEVYDTTGSPVVQFKFNKKDIKDFSRADRDIPISKKKHRKQQNKTGSYTGKQQQSNTQQAPAAAPAPVQQTTPPAAAPARPPSGRPRIPLAPLPRKK